METISTNKCSEVKLQRANNLHLYTEHKQCQIFDTQSNRFINIPVVTRMKAENNTGFVYDQDNSPSLCVDDTGNKLENEIDKYINVINYLFKTDGDDIEEAQISGLNEEYSTTSNCTVALYNQPNISNITIANQESINEPHNVMFESPAAQKVKFDEPILSCCSPILKELNDKLLTKNKDITVIAR